MGSDEEGTHASLNTHLCELIEPCIAEHRGRVVKRTGDALLAEFSSVLDAARCSIAMQVGMRQRNASAPIDRRIEFRIGVNIGDVIVEGDDIFGDGVNVAARLFPVTRRAAIEANLPFVVDGLRWRSLTDRPLVLMALATIRAETEGFLPISEGASRFNTRRSPFDLYDFGTRIGDKLGNTQRGDGALFKGRGYIQLTGRFNYTHVGNQIGSDLVSEPDIANHPKIAGLILAQFLSNKEGPIRTAIAANNLKKARKLVNGGSHGFARFEDAYNRGLKVLPD